MEVTEYATYPSAVAKYASVGALAVLIWDILDNIPADYHILFEKRDLRNKISFANCMYVSSRIGALGYQMGGVIFSIAPIRHCALLSNIAFGWCPLSLGATGLLFFLRLRAIYNRNRLIVVVFFIFWLALFASAITLPFGHKGGALGDTPYCTYISVSRVAFYSQLAPLVFDTLVFVAISWRLSCIGMISEMGVRGGNKTMGKMVFGSDLPAFTRRLLIDGQVYYLLTILAGVASVVLSFSSLVEGPLSSLLRDTYLVLVNIMACRVFRHTRSGAIRGSEISTSVLNEPISAPIHFRFELNRSSHVVSEESSVV